jgi:hypothetical protein
MLIDTDKPIYDTGQTDYGAYAQIKNKLFSVFFMNLNQKIEKQNLIFKADLHNKLTECRFDLVLLTPGQLDKLDYKQLKETYFNQGNINVAMEHSEQVWNLEIWYPACR